jgi:hypothetical protein
MVGWVDTRKPNIIRSYVTGRLVGCGSASSPTTSDTAVCEGIILNPVLIPPKKYWILTKDDNVLYLGFAEKVFS